MLKVKIFLCCRLSREINSGEIMEELDLQELIDAVQVSWDQTSTGLAFFFYVQRNCSKKCILSTG